MKHVKKQKNMTDHQKRKHSIEADPEMSQILGLSHEDFTITIL